MGKQSTADITKKIRGGETWIWVDKNGDVFECGLDFKIAEEKATYPCKVYRLSNVAGAHVKDEILEPGAELLIVK